VPTVISEAGDNPLIAEGAPMPEVDALSARAVNGEPSPVTTEVPTAEPKVETPASITTEIRPRRSSMKGGRAAAVAEEVVAPDAVEPSSDADVKVIKIDA